MLNTLRSLNLFISLMKQLCFSGALFALLLGLSVSAATAQDNSVTVEQLGELTIGGHVNTLATSLDRDFQNGSSGDTGAVDINSVELELSASPLKAVDATVVWLREEELDDGSPDDGFAVDQAYVTLSGNHRALGERDQRSDYDVSPWYVKAGKMYSPFGTQMEYQTFDVVSEPQTLALGETLESSFLVGWTPSDRVNLYGSIFSGDGADSEGGSAEDAEIDDFVVGADYESERGRISAQWTNNINNGIALVDELGNGADENAGLSLYGQFQHGPWNLQAAWVGATNSYDRGNLADSEPSATTVELTYSGLGQIMNRSIDGTLVYESTSEWFDHPDEVLGAVVDVPVYPGVTGSFEYVDRDYDDAFSSSLDDERLIAFQLSAEFSELIGQ